MLGEEKVDVNRTVVRGRRAVNIVDDAGKKSDLALTRQRIEE